MTAQGMRVRPACRDVMVMVHPMDVVTHRMGMGHGVAMDRYLSQRQSVRDLAAGAGRRGLERVRGAVRAGSQREAALEVGQPEITRTLAAGVIGARDNGVERRVLGSRYYRTVAEKITAGRCHGRPHEDGSRWSHAG